MKKKLGLWGYGNHAKRTIIPAISKSSHFDLVAVCSRQYATGLRSVDDQQLYFCNEDELLSNPDIDTIYVSTPIAMHYQNCMAAMTCGKNVLCEKSLTNSYVHSMELISLARTKGLFLAEAFMYVFHPQYLRLRRILTSDQLGKTCTLVCQFGLPRLENPGFRQNAELGGSAFWDVGCYNASLLIGLFDEMPRVISASRTVGPSGIDECGSSLLRFSSDASAFLTWAYNRSYCHQLALWTERGSVFAENIFSKGDRSRFVEIRDQFGARSDLDTTESNSFINMFDQMGASMDDPGYREYFWDTAERQAKLMNAIMVKLEKS